MRSITPRQTSCYCMNFRRMANALTKFYDESLAPAGLTANQLSLLADISSIQPCNQSELARRARLDRTTVIRNLELLRKKGLVETRQGQGHGGICLTEAGRAAMDEGHRYWERAQERIKGVFTPEIRETLELAFGQLEQIERLMER